MSERIVRVSSAELQERAQRLVRRLAACDLCPRRCGVDRLREERGYCGVGRQATLAAALPHFGEEPPISGTHGAGTLFLGGCNLRCTYCQNRQISSPTQPLRTVAARDLATEIERLLQQGCHNIEFVTPSHVVAQLLEALAIVADEGLPVPIVYNTGGYDSVETLRELDGVVDIYLPDLKYALADTAGELSGAPDYWATSTRAVREMLRQVGALDLGADGIAQRGVIVRHLVLPNDLAGTAEVLDFVAGLVPRPALSLMAQFYPIPECDHPLLQRPLFAAEYARARERAAALGLQSGWIQDASSQETYRPDFSRRDPFALRTGKKR